MKITLIATGGTLAKRYEPQQGELVITSSNDYLPSLLTYVSHNHQITVVDIIRKDSLDMTDDDRELIAQTLVTSDEYIIILHGTDTMHESASFLEQKQIKKVIIFVGAMHPLSILPFDGAMNLGSAIGFLQRDELSFGVYIAMHGLVKPYQNVVKNKKKGLFECR